VRSSSRLLEIDLLASEHRQVATAVRRLLTRYADLRLPMEMHRLGPDALWHIDDDPNIQQEINRARKLDRFLTQPLYGAEPWTGIVGEWVSVAETVAGCRALVEGQFDDWPEDLFCFVGGIEQVRQKSEGRGS
jgi:F-type H+/Na+-transporting ATPase subunit beta